MKKHHILQIILYLLIIITIIVFPYSDQLAYNTEKNSIFTIWSHIFAHSSINHLIYNIGFLIAGLFLIGKKLRALYVSLLFLLIPLLTILITHLQRPFLDMRGISGISYAFFIWGIMLFFFSDRWKKWLKNNQKIATSSAILIIVLTVFWIIIIDANNPSTNIIAHALGLSSGLIIASIQLGFFGEKSR